MLNPFLCTHWSFVSSLEKYLFGSSAHFLKLDCFLCYWVVWVPYLFWILTLIRCVVCKYFLLFQRLFFHFVNGFVDGFQKYGYFNINSPDARTRDIFPFVSVFSLFHLSLVVFSIEIFHLLVFDVIIIGIFFFFLFRYFIVSILGCCLNKIMSCANKDNYTSFFPFWVLFISFSCMIALGRTSNTMLNSDE